MCIRDSNITMKYEALSELSYYRVATPDHTRWGQPKDIQHLSKRLRSSFPSGIMVFDHCLGVAFQFLPNDCCRLFDLSLALHYAATYPTCLVLARFYIDKTCVTFARVEVKLDAGRIDAPNALMNDIILLHAVSGPFNEMSHGMPQSLKSAETSSNDPSSETSRAVPRSLESDETSSND